jgi:hypothetical protein
VGGWDLVVALPEPYSGVLGISPPVLAPVLLLVMPKTTRSSRRRIQLPPNTRVATGAVLAPGSRWEALSIALILTLIAGSIPRWGLIEQAWSLNFAGLKALPTALPRR